MNIESQQHTSASDQPAWKTEEYQGRQIRVCMEPRAAENQARSSHG